MKTAVLVYGYGLKNAGDMAITLGAITVLKEKGYSVNVISRYDNEHREFEKSKNYINKYFAECNIYASEFKLNRAGEISKLISGYAKGAVTLSGVKKNNIFVRLIKECDLVVFNGGNLFRGESFSDFARLLALMYPLRVASNLDKPFVVFPQSASNINYFGKLLMQKSVRRAEKIWCREEISRKYLSKRFGRNDIKGSFDLGFLLNYNSQKIQPTDKKKVAITIRGKTVGDLAYFKEKKLKVIIDSIFLTLKKLPKDYEFSFVLQTINDEQITNRVMAKAKKLPNKISFFESYDPFELMTYYNGCNVLLGMRLHSIIFALKAGTPAVGFFDREWGFKNQGTMDQFKLPYKFLNSGRDKDFSKEIKSMIENEREYRNSIINKIQEIKNRLIEEL